MFTCWLLHHEHCFEDTLRAQPNSIFLFLLSKVKIIIAWSLKDFCPSQLNIVKVFVDKRSLL
jgi:hypothetical protein